jgi:hypothetical protein
LSIVAAVRTRLYAAARRPRAVLAPAALLVLLGALALLTGCSAGLRDGDGDDARADVDAVSLSSCASTVLHALAVVARRVYREGVYSERTIVALRRIQSSSALRDAVERGDAAGARAAASALIATRRLNDLRVLRGGRVLVAVGSPAVAPLSGTLRDAAGRPLASFQTSVWAAHTLLADLNGLTTSQTALRSLDAPDAERTIDSFIELPPGSLPAQGTITRGGTAYEFSSIPVAAYPDGAPQRVYVVRTIASTASLCGASNEDTTFNTVSAIAHLIYESERGERTLRQIRRVQHNAALLRAVAHRDHAATRAAIEALLQEHVVRLRVSAGGRLLSDVGGPFVLAPVTAPLRAGGHTIGSFVLSIQDDEGYKRLAARLAGLDVLMYMGSRLVKSTLGPSPGPIPTSGSLRYRGKRLRAYTFTAEAFPSGPLRITVLIPMPYS